MSEDQDRPQVEGFGEYHPEAAAHRPYNDAMAAWRNQVKAMQSAGTLPTVQTPQDAAEPTREPEPTQEPPEAPDDAQGRSEPVQELKDAKGGEAANVVERTIDEALDLKEDGMPKEGNPEDDQDSGDGPTEVYDPAEHNAPEVLGYLRGVGEDEAVRVLESEEAGKARKGILNLRDDILAKARENDQTGSGSKEA